METEDGALVAEAKLKVLLESEYLNICDFHLRGENLHRAGGNHSSTSEEETFRLISEQLMKEIILPEITQEVNTSPNYAPLRQIYHSLILAQWFKRHVDRGGLHGKIKGLESEVPWSKQALWQEYLESFQKGEYKLTDTIFGLKRMYFSGGIEFFTGNGASSLEIISKLELEKNPSWIQKLMSGALVLALLSNSNALALGNAKEIPLIGKVNVIAQDLVEYESRIRSVSSAMADAFSLQDEDAEQREQIASSGIINVLSGKEALRKLKTPEILEIVFQLEQSLPRSDRWTKKDQIERALISNEFRCFVAMEEGRFIGYALYDYETQVLSRLMIVQEARGKGCGTQLLNQVLKSLSTSGIKKIKIYSDPDVRSFYEEYFKKNREWMIRESQFKTGEILAVKQASNSQSIFKKGQNVSSGLEHNTAGDMPNESGGIDLSQIELTLKDKKFVSSLNPADQQILFAAWALKQGWDSLA
ncbi:MAG: GNAT family N-acetyltransferase, partial [Candidatus Omnitrophota bacterium]|nr:GNAT family N-acetyltransferase [Candidatus Omnitrophota bacterium]